jgi:hypothetical protein
VGVVWADDVAVDEGAVVDGGAMYAEDGAVGAENIRYRSENRDEAVDTEA